MNRFKEAIAAAYVLQQRHGSFTASDLTTIEGFGPDTSISEMLRKGFVKRHGNQPARYELADRGRKQIRVFMVNGTFDIIHPGHLKFLRKVKDMCDVLVVVVGADNVVASLKRGRPVFPLMDRVMLVGGIKWVDYARPGYSEGKFPFERAMAEIMPDIVVFTPEQHYLERAAEAAIKSNEWPVRIMTVPRARAGKFRSSTQIREKIRAVDEQP